MACNPQTDTNKSFSEELLQTVFMQAGDGIFLVEDQKITAANPRGCEMFGYTHDEIIGLPLMEQIPADEIDHITQKLGMLAVTKSVIAESAFYRKDGSRIDVEISGRMLSNGQILGIMRDITERILARRALSDSEQQFRNLVENSPDGIFLVNENGIIVEWNRGHEIITGLERSSALGKPIWDVQLLLAPENMRSDAILSRVKKYFLEVLAFGNTPELNHLSEQMIQTPSGIVRNLEITLYAYKTDFGHRVGGVARDITRRKKAETALRDAQIKIMENERAMASFDERERLARELHDSIGQTFSYISMQSEAIREFTSRGDSESSLPMLARLSEVAQESHRDLRTYIQGLKSSAPIIHQEFFAALDRYCKHYEQSYIFQIKLNLPQNLPDVLASAQVETHLIYIIREAVGNARRYSGEKQASVTIDVEDEFVQAVIQDHGVGFDDKYSGPERRKGTHFGLRIMRERAEEVGGTVNVESAPSKGTRVIVRLPRKLSSREALAARIMIVDDHPLFIDGLRNMLAARGVHVIGAAKDGMEAREMARALKPDIILMDINMPRMNGLVAAHLIKLEMPEIKVAMLTTSMAEDDVLEALKVGASGYLPKGMGADEFMSRLAEITRGEAEFSASMANQLLEMFAQKTSDMAELTERQVEILKLVTQGLTYKEIGDRLYLTERTVKYHMGEILSRLHLKGRHEAEEYAKRRGMA